MTKSMIGANLNDRLEAYLEEARSAEETRSAKQITCEFSYSDLLEIKYWRDKFWENKNLHDTMAACLMTILEDDIVSMARDIAVDMIYQEVK